MNYDKLKMNEFMFYVNNSFTIPKELLISNCKDDIILETGNYSHFYTNNQGSIHEMTEISIINRNYKMTIIKPHLIDIIINNSDLNTSHKSPLFIECREAYERDKIINEILEID